MTIVAGRLVMCEGEILADSQGGAAKGYVR